MRRRIHKRLGFRILLRPTIRTRTGVSMNPWAIVAWIGAASVSAIIIVITAVIVASAIRTLTNKDRSTRVL